MVVVGVDAGATSIRAARFEDPGSTPTATVETSTPRDAGQLVPAMVGLCAELEPFDRIGVGIAGLVDHDSGDLVWMHHLHAGIPVGRELERSTGRAVAVDNDANVAALAEAAFGAGVGHRMVLMVTVGTGIGGGLVIDGVIERGRSFLGEIGHVPMDPAGPRCSCGLDGCWELYASGSALDRAAREVATRDPEGATARLAANREPIGRDLVEAAGSGDGLARDALEGVARWFGRGLGMLVSVFDPDVIVVGGGVVEAGEAFLQPARDAMAGSLSGSGPRSSTPVVAAAFGAGAGLVGAGVLGATPRAASPG